MKKQILILFATLLLGGLAQAQSPVSWSFSAKKIGMGAYELHMAANISAPWHLYSQFTPDGGPVATSVVFAKNPIVSFDGKVSEVGKLVVKREEVFGIDVKFFEGKVDFVQKLKVRGKAKTFVSGSIEYMVCNDKECLPPVKVPFKVELK